MASPSIAAALSEVAIYGVIMAIIMSNKMQGADEFVIPAVPKGWQVPAAGGARTGALLLGSRSSFFRVGVSLRDRVLGPARIEGEQPS